MVAIAGIVTILLVVLLVQSQHLSEKNASYESHKEELEQQIQDETVRAEDIEKLKEYVDSEEFIEKMAREKLGLAYPDEIVFKIEEK